MHDEAAKQRFLREAQAASATNHRNICIIHDIEQTDDGQLFIVMAHYEGETLKQKLEKGPLPMPEALEIATEIAEGLAKAHAQGVVHRDIKPGNLMLTEDGVKILDFGLAKLADAALKLTMEGSTLGTVAYMSPEQARGEEADERSDIWALGVVLYEMLTGRCPFKGTYPEAIFYAIKNEPPVPMAGTGKDIPETVERVVLRALAKDPSERYQTARELARELRFLQGRSVPLDLRTEPLPPVERSAGGATASVFETIRESAHPHFASTRAVVLAVSVVMVSAIAGLLWTPLRERWFPAPATGPIRSIAVLPLANLSGDPEQEYFADGMTDELIATLGGVEGLKVISRTSVMRFKGSTTPLPEIAQALGVDAVLEGSVVVLPGHVQPKGSDGKRVRINARLIHAASDVQVWNRTFERVVADVLGLQSEVARAVTEGIDSRLTGPNLDRASRGQDFDVFDLYLRGRYYWNMRTAEGFKRSIQYFQEVINRDPRYAPAYAGLADAYNMLGMYGIMQRAEASARAAVEASRALDLDGSLAEAHASLALVHMERFQWNAAGDNFSRAIKLKPGYATGHHWYAICLALQGRLTEAVSEANKALALDPLSSIVNTNLGTTFILARRYDDAVRQLEKTLQIDPGFARARVVLAEALIQQGAHDRALAELDAAAPAAEDVVVRANIGHIFAVTGRRAEALAIANELTERYRKNDPAAAGAVVFVFVGLRDNDRAFEWLDRAVQLHDPWIAYLKVEPRFDSLRPDPRFASLLASMGLAQ
jgi:serine/threonine-protein kinase